MAIDWKIIEKLKLMRSEETLRFLWSEDGKVVSIERAWKGTPTYQLQGQVRQFEEMLNIVLPRSDFRDRKGFEPTPERE